MLTQISSALTEVIGMCGSVVTAVFGESGALADLAPLFFISVAVSGIFVGIKLIRSLVWGA